MSDQNNTTQNQLQNNRDMILMQQECTFLAVFGSLLMLPTALLSAFDGAPPVMATITIAVLLLFVFLVEPGITPVVMYDQDQNTFKEVDAKAKIAAICNIRKPLPMLWLCAADVCIVVAAWCVTLFGGAQ